MKRLIHKNTHYGITFAKETQSRIRFTQKVQHLTAMSWPQKYDALRKGIKVRSKNKIVRFFSGERWSQQFGRSNPSAWHRSKILFKEELVRAKAFNFAAALNCKFKRIKNNNQGNLLNICYCYTEKFDDSFNLAITVNVSCISRRKKGSGEEKYKSHIEMLHDFQAYLKFLKKGES